MFIEKIMKKFGMHNKPDNWPSVKRAQKPFLNFRYENAKLVSSLLPVKEILQFYEQNEDKIISF